MYLLKEIFNFLKFSYLFWEGESVCELKRGSERGREKETKLTEQSPKQGSNSWTERDILGLVIYFKYKLLLGIYKQ